MTDNADHRVVTFKDAAQRDAYNAAFRAAWADAVAKGLSREEAHEIAGKAAYAVCKDNDEQG